MSLTRDERSMLNWIAQRLYTHGQVLAELVKTAERIEKLQGGSVDPKLQRAVAMLAAKAEILDEAVDSQNESKANPST